MPVEVWHEHCFRQGCPPIRCRRKVAFRRGAAEGGVYETESTLPIWVYRRRPRYEHNQCARPDQRSTGDSTSPKKSELVFNQYGSRYFLSKLFDQGEKVGSAVVESGYLKQYASGGASDGEKDVPASHPGN
jgi:hypothetical protein